MSKKITDELLYKYCKTVDEYITDKIPNDEEINHTYSEEFENKIKKIIKQENKHNFVAKFYKYSKKVAIIFLIIISVLGATMSIDAIRYRVLEFIKNVRREDMKTFLGEEMGFWKQFPISWEQEKKLRDEFEKSFVKNKVVFAESMYSKSEPMAARAKEVMDEIAMVGWVSGGHSAGYVPVFAIGAGSQLFGEKIDNTEIPKRIAKAAGYK